MLLPFIEHKYYCWAWNRIYIKANGRIPSWCDAGESHTIIHRDLGAADFIPDVVNSPEMRQMRLTVIRDSQPYIPECHDCCCFLTQHKPKFKRHKDSEIATNVSQLAIAAEKELYRVTRSHDWPLGSIDHIREIQLEPSFPCNLRCPGCLHGWHEAPLQTETGPYLFPVEWFYKLIESVTQHNVRLDRIAFVGRGEPTLNKNFSRMIEHARTTLPGLIMSMDTNSTQPFNDNYLLLNWINCSIDGSTPDSYATYRRGGDFEAAINFMHRAVQRKQQFSSHCLIRWKYILFDTTASVKLLDQAQHLARDIGIDELNFVVTNCGSADRSVNPDTRTLADIADYIRQSPIFSNTIASRS